MARGKVKKVFLDDVGAKNPVFVQILGICSTLAVTNVLRNTVIMSLGLIFATALSSFTVSILRKIIPSRIRMMVETLIIAAYVILVDIVLRAFVPDVSRQLGPYVGLIITNCIVLGRAEAFALQNPPLRSLLDGVGNGLGYGLVLLAVGFFRELLGSGKLLGRAVLPPVSEGGWYEPNNLFLLSPSAFILIGLFIWALRTWKPEQAEED